MRLNLHLVRIFHTVAEEGSFSAAARRLHISQPAVSKAVSELERHLDTALLERAGGRRGQSMMLTEAGAALDAHARSIFALERAAVEEVQQRRGLKRGSLVVGASTTIASYWLPHYLKTFAKRWPDIDLRLVVANTQAISEDLLDCKLDLALVEGPVHVSGLAHYPWREERLVIVGPPHSPEEVADLAKGTWLVREVGSGTREVSFEILAKLGI